MIAGNYRLLNPLDKFRSYSVHHVLLAAASTVDAQPFLDKGRDTEALDAINRTKRLGDKVPLNNSAVRLVLDTRRFSQFSVEKLDYEVSVNEVARGGSANNFASALNMTILDAVGVSFINFIQELMDEKLKTNFDGLVFVLRTIFVGHTTGVEAGQQIETTTVPGIEFVQSVSIPLVLKSMELDLNYVRGSYLCTFFPMINFQQSANRRWLQISNVSSFFSDEGGTLGSLIDSFEAALNTRSLDFYNNFNAIVKQLDLEGQLEGTRKQDARGGYGRSVQYVISIPASWREFKVSGRSVASAVEADWKKVLQQQDVKNKGVAEADPSKSVHASVAPGISITEALDTVFKQVNGVNKLANYDTVSTNQDAKFYKYNVGLTSDDQTFIVHVDVVEFTVSSLTVDEKKRQQVGYNSSDRYTVDPKTGDVVPKMTFELDYIHTGKNKDVLGMELKIQELQFLIGAKTSTGFQAMLQKATESGITASDQARQELAKKTELLNIRQGDPVMLPLNTSESLTAFSSVVSNLNRDPTVTSNAQEYNRNVSLFYTGSPIEATLTLRGNPDIMAQFSVESFLPHMPTITTAASSTSAPNANTKDAYRRLFEQNILTRSPDLQQRSTDTFRVLDKPYMSGPVYVKVNIFGPAIDGNGSVIDLSAVGTDPSTGRPTSANIELFYDAYFIVMGVKNTIDNGVFTQELKLLSHCLYGMDRLVKGRQGTK